VFIERLETEHVLRVIEEEEEEKEEEGEKWRFHVMFMVWTMMLEADYEDRARINT
jgi:hypothetical protein